MVGVSARIGVDLCPLKLSGLGGLRAPFPGMTAPCILKGPVSAGMLHASRAAAATLQNLLVTLWLIYLAAWSRGDIEKHVLCLLVLSVVSVHGRQDLN